MQRLDQNRTPLFDALKRYKERQTVAFHVPGHKHGKGLKEFTDYVGENLMWLDVNGMEDLDNVCNPVGVIKETQQLAAEAFGADYAYFLVNGTSSGVQAMIMAACEPGDEIIIPRNAHKSTIGGIILSGAIPVYIQPEINHDLGIAMGVSVSSVKAAIEAHPYAKAIFLINPTYYGVASDLKAIVELAHENDMMVLVDEAHGAHLGFHPDFPMSAMMAGADMSAVSMHKTGGSMTQSSMLLLKGDKLDPGYVKSVLNLTQTTSASYVLMASLDVARKQLATKGRQMLDEVLRLSRTARNKINEIPGLRAFGKEVTGTPGSFAFDETKLGVNVMGLGLTGFEVESLLRKRYDIQVEMADLYNILAIVSLGDDEISIAKLVDGLRGIAADHGGHTIKNATRSPIMPDLIVSPRDAYYSRKKVVRLEDAEGEISGEMVMAYPPGIPVVCPGERITAEIIDYIKALKNEKCQLQGTEDPYADYIKVLGQDYYN